MDTTLFIRGFFALFFIAIILWLFWRPIPKGGKGNSRLLNPGKYQNIDVKTLEEVIHHKNPRNYKEYFGLFPEACAKCGSVIRFSPLGHGRAWRGHGRQSGERR